jgi:carbon-monoxide dehydrogenase large subunit
MAFDEDGAIQATFIDFVSDCGAYPTPWPVMTATSERGSDVPGLVRYIPLATAIIPTTWLRSKQIT